MKKTVSVAVWALLAGLLVSCASPPPPPGAPGGPLYRPLADVPGAHVVGFAQTNFEMPATPRGASADYSRISSLAHAALLEAARREHSGNIDIVDVTWAVISDGSAQRRNSSGVSTRVGGTIGLVGGSGISISASGSVPVQAAQGGSQMVTYSATGRVVSFND